MRCTVITDCAATLAEYGRVWKRAGRVDDFFNIYWRNVAAMLSTITALSAAERESLFTSITRAETGLLFGVARSAAEGSVRRRDPSCLPLGMLSLIVENLSDDYRHTTIEVCLLNNSARKLNIELAKTYSDLRHFATPKAAEFFDDYFESGARDIAMMGYVEEEGENGFRYRQNW